MHYRFGQYELNTGSRTLRHAGRKVEIQSRAFDVLAYLIERRERFVTADELLEALWPDVHVTPAAVSTAVRKARQAVGDDGDQQAVLRTKLGYGFQFVAEVRVVGAREAPTAVPTRSRARVAASAGAAALLLVAAAAWLLSPPITEPAPARSVAVLPFTNLSQDAAAEPFTNGIYDDILTHIARIDGLKVIARTTMERLDPGMGIQEIGTELGVATVLEGGVQRAGGRIRINVQLNDCETETHIWAETYDRELTAVNVFGIQSEIATSVADALRAELSPIEQETIAIVPTENLDAYEAYLLGRQRLSRFTVVAVEAAINYFRQAIELDPSYALAYVGLADSYLRQARWTRSPFAETLAKAKAMAEKARALNDRLGEVHASIALIKELEWDFEGAEAAYQRALELSPNYATAYEWYGSFLNVKMNRPEEALSTLLRAAEIDPLSSRIVSTMGSSLERQGRFEQALARYKRAYELDPMQDSASWNIGLYHWSVTGELDQAVVWLRRAAFIDRDFSGNIVPLGRVFLDLGDPGNAAYWVERSIEINPRWLDGIRAIAFLHLYRGDEAAAVNQARKTLAVSPRDWSSLLLLRNHELSADRYAEARALYEEIHPELLSGNDPEVGRMNFRPAIDLALVLSNTGEKERADLLLEKSLQQIHTIPRLGRMGHGIADVQIYALQGEKQKALAALRQAIDEGWRTMWWYYLQREPNLVSLHGEPEFQAMVDEIKADMAAQLERVREMERNGEFAAIPRGKTNLH